MSGNYLLKITTYSYAIPASTAAPLQNTSVDMKIVGLTCPTRHSYRAPRRRVKAGVDPPTGLSQPSASVSIPHAFRSKDSACVCPFRQHVLGSGSGKRLAVHIGIMVIAVQKLVSRLSFRVSW
jgi:hypothetical protein